MRQTWRSLSCVGSAFSTAGSLKFRDSTHWQTLRSRLIHLIETANHMFLRMPRRSFSVSSRGGKAELTYHRPRQPLCNLFRKICQMHSPELGSPEKLSDRFQFNSLDRHNAGRFHNRIKIYREQRDCVSHAGQRPKRSKASSHSPCV